jgi:hypothetical protein
LAKIGLSKYGICHQFGHNTGLEIRWRFLSFFLNFSTDFKF